MIALENVTMLAPGFGRRQPILEGATATFRIGERTGILAAPGSGKSTLARLLAGIETPDRGKIRINGSVSWPIGFAGFLHPSLSVRDNLAVFARLKGLSIESVAEFCSDFCNIDSLLGRKMAHLTPTQRAMLAYACAMADASPAIWVADEVITIGQPDDRKRCDAILAQRLEYGGLVFLSRNARVLKLYCDRFLVLANQRLVPCDDLDCAQETLESLTREQEFAPSEVQI